MSRNSSFYVTCPAKLGWPLVISILSVNREILKKCVNRKANMRIPPDLLAVDASGWRSAGQSPKENIQEIIRSYVATSSTMTKVTYFLPISANALLQTDPAY